MDIFDVLSLIGGLCLFLFGMNLMGAYLEKSAGGGLKNLLGKLTTGKLAGFATGLGVTSVIQSSSATTVMVVGFVNSGLMTLKQAINVIMGANVGTTVTAWILSLSGIEGDNVFVQLCKPSSFTPILALIGIILYIFCKSNRQKDIGVILLGFATLMFGMDSMSAAVSDLKNDPAFANILIMFNNPILGVVAGAVLTGVIQSSSASVGILQALSTTGQINVGMSIPIIMGQNIGTCVTALISSVGTNRNARRASIVHLFFNIIGTIIMLILFCSANAIFDISIFNSEASEFTIAVCHSTFNIACTIIMLPCAGLLEKLAITLIPEPKNQVKEEKIELDERLMATPAVAIDRCRVVTSEMAEISVEALNMSLLTLNMYDQDTAKKIKDYEKKVDHYEDILGSYLVKLNTYPLSDKDSHESAKLLHMIGDFERVSDHAVNILESAEEIHSKNMKFTENAYKELSVIIAALKETVEQTMLAFNNDDMDAASHVEPLEQVIDLLKDKLRNNHIARLQKGECTIEAGFVWSDLLNNLERISDHCSNIAGCIIEMSHDSLDVHEYLKNIRAGNREYNEMYEDFVKKYSLKV